MKNFDNLTFRCYQIIPTRPPKRNRVGWTTANPSVTSPRTPRTRRIQFGHPLPKSVLPTSKSDQPQMDALLAEVSLLRQEVAALRESQSSSKKSPCQGVTGKGTPCRNGALVGTPYCRMHSRPTKEAKPPRTRKEPKPKKIVPEHTHPIGESHPHCALCQTHGDCMDPTLPEHNFEGSDDITERLRELLSRERVCGETESVWSAHWLRLGMV